MVALAGLVRCLSNVRCAAHRTLAANVGLWPTAGAKNLLAILLWNGVRPAVEWSVHAVSANSGLEELPLRAGFLEALHCRGVDFAVVVVGRLELNDHVPLCFVVANARNVTALSDVRARKGVK